MAGSAARGFTIRKEAGERQNTGSPRPGDRDRCGGGLRLLLRGGGARWAAGSLQVRGARVLRFQRGGCRILPKGLVSAALLFALAVSLCAVVVAVLLVTTWRDEDLVVSAVVAFVLLPILVLAIMAWREAL